ncbi:MAG: ABC transporter permease, partial [Planctomycetota bacterium]
MTADVRKQSAGRTKGAHSFRKFQQASILILLVALCVFASFRSSTFLTWTNIVDNLFTNAAAIGIVALGMTFVMIVVCSVVLVMSMDWLSPHGAAVAIPAALLLTVLVGVILGAINGTLIAYIGVNPFVVTLCTMLIFRGIAQILTGGGQTQQVHDILLRKRFDWFYDAGLRLCGGVGISMPILIFLVVFAVGIYLLRFTRFGHYVYAIGGNEEAAWLAGVNTHRIKALTYVLCGFTCAIAAVIFVAKTETAGAESH